MLKQTTSVEETEKANSSVSVISPSQEYLESVLTSSGSAAINSRIFRLEYVRIVVITSSVKKANQMSIDDFAAFALLFRAASAGRILAALVRQHDIDDFVHLYSFLSISEINCFLGIEGTDSMKFRSSRAESIDEIFPSRLEH